VKEILEKYEKEGLVQKQVHPTLPLTIWNYTPKVQYGENFKRYVYWDEVTSQTRGLVTDDKGNVVARPFKKFFNLDENRHTPTEEFEVFEKMDGSLGILFSYQGEWVLATRGSFTSDQAVRGTKILQKYDYKRLNPNYTYLFEIIYPENRIVVNYDFEDLVLLAVIKTDDGTELNLHDGEYDLRVVNQIKNLGFNIVRRFDKLNKDFTLLKHAVPDSKEGYVIRFSNGDRLKIKGDEYVRLHKIMSNLTNMSIWEALSEGKEVTSILEGVPDEIFNKVKEYESKLKYGFYLIGEQCGKAHDYFRYGKYNDIDPEPTKKEYAEHVLKNSHPPYRPVMFAMWDKKKYDHLIWNILKPKKVEKL